MIPAMQKLRFFQLFRTNLFEFFIFTINVKGTVNEFLLFYIHYVVLIIIFSFNVMNKCKKMANICEL